MPRSLFVKKILLGGKNRTRIEIAADILTLSQQSQYGCFPPTLTTLIYSANLSFKLVDDYVNLLVKSGLLARVHNAKYPTPSTVRHDIYTTTLKGEEFLRNVKELKEMVDDVINIAAAIEMDLGGKR